MNRNATLKTVLAALVLAFLFALTLTAAAQEATEAPTDEASVEEIQATAVQVQEDAAEATPDETAEGEAEATAAVEGAGEGEAAAAPAGVSTLVLLVGIAAALLVGAASLARDREADKTEQK
jgi:cobalamin biosynthesis Mg chelatase CobN